MDDKVAVFTTAWLVWVESPLGPRPQVWFEDAGNFVGPTGLAWVVRYELPRHLARAPLDHLVLLYPLIEKLEAA